MKALINPKAWIALALAVVLVFAGTVLYRAGKAAVRADWNAQKAVDAEARVLADRAQRTEETRRQAAFDKEALDAQTRLADLQADFDAARDSTVGLQRAADLAASRARARACAPTASAGEPDSDPIGVFALVLGRASARSEVVDRYVDAVRLAADTCERAGDALQPAGP